MGVSGRRSATVGVEVGTTVETLTGDAVDVGTTIGTLSWDAYGRRTAGVG